MPLVIDEMAGSRLGKEELSLRNGFYVLNNTADRRHYVLGDTLADDEDTILATTGVPQIGAVIQGAVCLEREAKETHRVRHPITGVACGLWEVRSRFDSNVDTQAQNEANLPPPARTPEWTWDSEEEQEQLEKDAVTGEPIETKAGEQIIVTHPVTVPVLTITRYETWPFDPNIKLVYENRVNSAAFWGAPIGTAKMARIRAAPEAIDNTRYAAVEYVIKFKLRDDPDNPGSLLADTWKGSVLHQGHQYLDDSESGSGGPAIVRAVDENDHPIVVNLDADGGRLPDNAAIDDRTFITFNRHGRVDFNNLSLGPF